MEASEKPQLSLDGDGSEGVVRALDDRLVIERLTVADERAARLVRERADAGRAAVETVAKAIEVGARVLDSEGTAANVDYVRAEFERQAAELKERLARAMESGDQQLAERIAASFDGSRDGSVQQQMREVLRGALEDQRTTLLRLFTTDEGANPLSDFKGAVVRAISESDARQRSENEENRKQIDSMKRELIELKQLQEAGRLLAEAEEAGTRKGRSFEERVHLVLERLAEERGDGAHRVGDEAAVGGGKRGDVVTELDAAEGPCSGRIAWEVKDARLSKREAWDVLDKALEQRQADFAVLVVGGEEKVPAGRKQLHEYEGNKMVVAVDREDPEPLVLGTAYSLSRARVRIRRDRSLEVDAAGVLDAAEGATSALRQAQQIKRALTGASENVGTARTALEEMEAAVRGHLERIETLVAQVQEA